MENTGNICSYCNFVCQSKVESRFIPFLAIISLDLGTSNRFIELMRIIKTNMQSELRVNYHA